MRIGLVPVTTWHIGADHAAVTLVLANDVDPMRRARIYVLSVEQALDLAGSLAQAMARTSGSLVNGLRRGTGADD